MVTRSVDIRELHQNLEALLIEVKSGIELVVMDDNLPVARLVPPQVLSKKREPGLHRGSMQMADDFDAPLPDNFWLGDA